MKAGIVTKIEIMGHGLKHLHIKLDNGDWCLFFEDFKGFPRSLKVNDRVKVWFKTSAITGITVPTIARKIKKGAV